jgi:hypothetical protein
VTDGPVAAHMVGAGVGTDLALTLANGLGAVGETIGGVARIGVSWLICQGAQCSQAYPIGSSHTKSCHFTCTLPDVFWNAASAYLMKVMGELETCL